MNPTANAPDHISPAPPSPPHHSSTAVRAPAKRPRQSHATCASMSPARRPASRALRLRTRRAPRRHPPARSRRASNAVEQVSRRTRFASLRRCDFSGTPVSIANDLVGLADVYRQQHHLLTLDVHPRLQLDPRLVVPPRVMDIHAYAFASTSPTARKITLRKCPEHSRSTHISACILAPRRLPIHCTAIGCEGSGLPGAVASSTSSGGAESSARVRVGAAEHEAPRNHRARHEHSEPAAANLLGSTRVIASIIAAVAHALTRASGACGARARETPPPGRSTTTTDGPRHARPRPARTSPRRLRVRGSSGFSDFPTSSCHIFWNAVTVPSRDARRGGVIA